jgi:hypothetical protein
VTKKDFLMFLSMILVVSSNLFFLASTFRIHRQPLDTVSTVERRFQPVKSFLSDNDVITYVCDPRESKVPFPHSNVGDEPMPNSTALLEYLMVQYAMAPRILVHHPYGTLILGNFKTPLPDMQPYGFAIVRSFPDGACLLKRTKR